MWNKVPDLIALSDGSLLSVYAFNNHRYRIVYFALFVI